MEFATFLVRIGVLMVLIFILNSTYMKKSFLMIIIFTAVFLLPLLVMAQTSPSPGTTVTIPNPLGTDSIPEVIGRIIDFLLKVAVPLATLVVLYAGFLFLTAGGDTEKINQAKKALLWAVIGVVVLMMARGVIEVIKSILIS